MTPRTEGVSSGGRSTRVLIVEDDPRGQELLAALIEELGYEAVVVMDGEAALRSISTTPPDIVLSDVNMPKMNGYELCRRLKGDRATRLIPVILITGVGDGHKTEGIEAGADDFLSKPFLLGELRVRLRSFLRMKGLPTSWNPPKPS